MDGYEKFFDFDNDGELSRHERDTMEDFMVYEWDMNREMEERERRRWESDEWDEFDEDDEDEDDEILCSEEWINNGPDDMEETSKVFCSLLDAFLKNWE